MTTHFCKPLADWPLLLCGPMLRRVTKNSVAVFIATKTACAVRLLVRERGRTALPAWPFESSVQATRQIGKNLHVLVIELTTAIELWPNTVYDYDVEMTPAGGTRQGLAAQAGLLQGTDFPLGYDVGACPSFSLTPGMAKACILHGSCRKPHGGGPDALQIADELIRISSEHPVDYAAKRPHLLLLTGDQIYADDVSAALLLSLRAAAEILMGDEVQFAEYFQPGSLGLLATTIWPGQRRMAWLQGQTNTQLTSDARDNHLMFLGEFYAMYLFCWSDALWTKLTINEWLPQDTLYPSMKDNTDKAWQSAVSEAYWKQYKFMQDLAQFAADVRRVRRALANVPTMMAFDDHEITDDWNIDKSWNNEARLDPGLKRIVRNGLAAYAVFQCWGNEPSRFATGKGAELLTMLAAANPASRPRIMSEPDCADTLLDLTETRVTDTSMRVRWDWTLDGEGYRVIALDTRTHRDFDDGEHVGLLKPAEIVEQLVRHRPLPGEHRLCFVIAPAPLIGHPLVEEIVQPLAAEQAGVHGRRSADLEAWSAKRECMEVLLSTLSGFGAVVVLSGDVHYAYTNYTAYHAGAGPGNQVHARIVQLCSSALKNAESKTFVIQKAGYAGFENQGRGWFGTRRDAPFLVREKLALTEFALTSRHPWDEVQLINILNVRGEELGNNWLGRALANGLRLGIIGSGTDAVDKFMVGAYARVMAPHIMKEQPLVLPDGPWLSHARLSQAQALFANDASGWSYKTTYVLDRRTDGTQLIVVPRKEVTPSHRRSNVNEAFTFDARAVVGRPNLGEIKVVFMPGEPTRLKQVEHHLHWWLANYKRACTVHIAPLTLPVTGTPAQADELPVLYL